MTLEPEVREGQAERPISRPVSTAPGQIPLIFGVAGHRDLRAQDIETLENVVRGIFQEFRQQHPATPLVLLSPLAEGADRLAARVALECGIRLVVPLPMPRSLYRLEFETPKCQSEFDELLEKAEEWFEMPPASGSARGGSEDGTLSREWQYAQASAYVVRQCQILLALWDGQPSEKFAGTAEIVGLRASGATAHSLESLGKGRKAGHLDPTESGPVFHVVTPRAGSAQPPDDAFTVRREFHPRDPRSDEDEAGTGEAASHRRKNAQAETAYTQIYANLDSYNRSAQWLESVPRLTAQRRQSEQYLIPDAEAERLPSDLRTLRTCHAVADTLASLYQQDTEKVLIVLSLLVFVAASLFETYEANHDPWFLLTYPLFLGVVYLGWSFGVKRGRWQDKYQDYRALAEGLRVAFFWRLVGQTIPVTDHYLHKQRSEMDWIRIAIQNAGGDRQFRPADALPEDQRRKRWELALKHWVEDQSRYFTRSAIPKNEKMLEGAERGIKRLLLGSLIIPAALALLLIPQEPPESVARVIEPVRHWLEEGGREHALVALSALMAVVAGLLHTYADKKAFAQHIKQYKRMEHLFARAERRLREYIAHENEHHAAELILELGQESLEENGDWVLTHRERPVDVPHVG